jgi:CheY-like chemotaxis protein
MPSLLCLDDGTYAFCEQAVQLERHGVKVLVAADVEEFLHILATAPVEAVLLDCNQPCLDTRKLAATVKDVRPGTRIMMVAARRVGEMNCRNGRKSSTTRMRTETDGGEVESIVVPPFLRLTVSIRLVDKQGRLT